MEDGWRGTRIQDPERKREGRIEEPRRRDCNRKVPRTREARGFGGRDKPRWWRRKRMRKQKKKKKRIRGFSRRRVEWLGGRIIELPLIPSSPRYPRVKRGKRSAEETVHRERERERDRQWRWHGSVGRDRDEENEGDQDGRSWFVCRRRRRVGTRRTE